MDLKFKDNSQLRLAPFTQLEYIESTGTQYIDTGILAKVTDNFEIEYQFISGSGERSVFGIHGAALANMIMYDGWWWGGNSRYSYSQGIIKHILTKNNNIWTLDGTQLSYTTNSGNIPTGNWSLFTAKSGSDYTSYAATAKIYRFKLYRGNTLLVDFVPALDNNKTPCMFDTVSKTFFYNKGTGNFIAGPVLKLGFPENIFLKITTFYHKNTPNVDGRQFLNYIFDYQKTHQDEVKEYYYPTTQLWQTIITEYPDIVQYYNMNHKLCIPICEADDPEQFTEDLLEIIGDYPDIVAIIVENPYIVGIIVENPEVVHSLIDTGYETFLTSSGTQSIDSRIIPTNNFGFETSFRINSYNGAIFGEYTSDYNTKGYVSLEFYNNGSFKGFIKSKSSNNSVNPNATLGVKQNVSYTQGVFVAADGVTTNYNPTINTQEKTLYVFCRNAPSGIDYLISADIYYLKLYDGDSLIRWFVPIQNNGNPCMIDLLTGTKYLNQGTGSFTYSLEPKNA